MKKLTWLSLGLAVAATGCSTAAQQQEPQLAAAHAGCQQLGDASQAAQPFYAPGQVYAAQAMEERQFIARAIQPRRTVGAELYMHAPPGVTGEYLERALTCHAASGRAAHPNDPMHPASGEIAELRVKSASGGFKVEVIGENPSVGEEIWQRSRAFTSPSSSVTVEQVGSVTPPTHTF